MTRAQYPQNHKHIIALTAALAMTVFIGSAMLAFGVNAILSPNHSETAQAAGPVSAGAASNQTAADQALIDQLQAQISEYQSREAKFQTELTNAADQINQLNQQAQEYQSLFSALQKAGVINVSADGHIFIPNSVTSSFEREQDDD